MRNRLLSLAFICLMLTTAAGAQNQPNGGNADPQDAARQMREQIIQNMQAKGIDPQEFFGQIRQQMQDGTFDPQKLQQMMIDKGIIDKQTAEKMQTTMQSAALSRIREQLEATDAEWTIIQPKIQKVLQALAEASPPNQRGGMSMMMGMSMGASIVAKATSDLRAALSDPKTSDQSIGLRLQAFREAHEKAQSNLAAAQKDLVEVLTVRQEAVLMQMGIVP